MCACDCEAQGWFIDERNAPSKFSKNNLDLQLYDFVKNKQKAIELGKALFWDMQVGSDGVIPGNTSRLGVKRDNVEVGRRHNDLVAGKRETELMG